MDKTYQPWSKQYTVILSRTINLNCTVYQTTTIQRNRVINLTMTIYQYSIKHDIYATRRFEKGGYHSLWNDADILIKYPSFWQRVKLLTIAFPTSYLFEMGFNKVNSLLTNKRNKFNVTSGGDLRLALTECMPDVENLCRQGRTFKCGLQWIIAD